MAKFEAVEGFTSGGTHVVVSELGSYQFRVEIDGRIVSVTGVSYLRDGGSKIIETELGRVILSRRMGQQPWESFQGERLYPHG